MTGYKYKGAGKDVSTAWMDREPAPLRKNLKNNSNMCKRCRRGYRTRYHQEICRAEVATEYAARPPARKRRKTPSKGGGNLCKKCGHDYRSKLHKEGCKECTT